jgi:hypothetical protein
MIKTEESAPALRRLVVPMQQSIHGQSSSACICMVKRVVRVVALLSHGNEIYLIFHVLHHHAILKLEIGSLPARELLLANRSRELAPI